MLLAQSMTVAWYNKKRTYFLCKCAVVVRIDITQTTPIDSTSFVCFMPFNNCFSPVTNITYKVFLFYFTWTFPVDRSSFCLNYVIASLETRSDRSAFTGGLSRAPFECQEMEWPIRETVFALFPNWRFLHLFSMTKAAFFFLNTPVAAFRERMPSTCPEQGIISLVHKPGLISAATSRMKNVIKFPDRPVVLKQKMS